MFLLFFTSLRASPFVLCVCSFENLTIRVHIPEAAFKSSSFSVGQSLDLADSA